MIIMLLHTMMMIPSLIHVRKKKESAWTEQDRERERRMEKGERIQTDQVRERAEALS